MQSPERYRKPMYQQTNFSEFQNSHTQSQQSPLVDMLHTNRENKLFFDKIEPQGTEYNPYGAPGSGAPLRDENNDVVYKLPKLEENLWKQQSRQPSPIKQQQDIQRSISPIDQKRQEIHRLIDSLTAKQQRKQSIHNDLSYSQPTLHRTTSYYHKPTIVQSTRSHYWNDWFGRPGAGAPNWDTRKQNLDQLLEPRIITARNGHYYDPTVSLNTSRQRYRSNHHNQYEYSPL
jgi:hypothetical protein